MTFQRSGSNGAREKMTEFGLFFDCQGKLSRAQRRYTSAKALSSQDKFLRETSPCACKVLIWPPRKARQGGGLPARAKEDLVKRRWKMERRDGGKKSERKVPGNSHYPIPILTQKMSSGLWKIFGDLASHLLLRVIFSRLYGVWESLSIFSRRDQRKRRNRDIHERECEPDQGKNFIERAWLFCYRSPAPTKLVANLG